MRPLRAPDETLRQSLVEALGAADFDTAHGEGERLSPTQVLELVSAGERGRPG